MKSYGGTIVLAGHQDVSLMWREHLQPESPFVYGDIQTGQIRLTDPVSDPVEHVKQGLICKPFSFVCGGDPYYTAHIPTRDTSICVWSHGPNHLVKDAVRLLLNINREPVQLHYAELVQHRVFSQMPGHYTLALGYFGKHSRILLCARGLAMYMWICYFNGVYSLTWSTDPQYIEHCRQFVPDAMRHDFFVYHMPLVNGSLAIQPFYVASKLKKYLRESSSAAPKLTVVSYMANYILDSIQYFRP